MPFAFVLTAMACARGSTTTLAPRESSIARRAASHLFPRLANQYQVGDWGATGRVLYERLPWWDLILAFSELPLLGPEYLGENGLIRTANPDAIVISYFSGADINRNYDLPVNAGYNSGVRPGWIMKDIAGNEVDLFELAPGVWTQLLNPTTPIQRYLPDYVAETILALGLTDGMFLDWASTSISFLNHRTEPRGLPIDVDGDGIAESDRELDRLWTAGYSRMLDNLRHDSPADDIIVGNAGWNTGAAYDRHLNGVMIEGFMEGTGVDPRSFGWGALMRTYAHYQTSALSPRLSVIMANRDDQMDFHFMRFALASTLMFDGYFIFTNKHVPGPAYQTARWYDEYSVDRLSGQAVRRMNAKGYLGQPVSDAYSVVDHSEKLGARLRSREQVEDRVWRRDFEFGIVLVNPSMVARSVDLGDRFRKIAGTVDPEFNDGSVVAGVTLAAQGGLILLRR